MEKHAVLKIPLKQNSIKAAFSQALIYKILSLKNKFLSQLKGELKSNFAGNGSNHHEGTFLMRLITKLIKRNNGMQLQHENS